MRARKWSVRDDRILQNDQAWWTISAFRTCGADLLTAQRLQSHTNLEHRIFRRYIPSASAKQWESKVSAKHSEICPGWFPRYWADARSISLLLVNALQRKSCLNRSLRSRTCCISTQAWLCWEVQHWRQICWCDAWIRSFNPWIMQDSKHRLLWRSN